MVFTLEPTFESVDVPNDLIFPPWTKTKPFSMISSPVKIRTSLIMKLESAISVFTRRQLQQESIATNRTTNSRNDKETQPQHGKATAQQPPKPGHRGSTPRSYTRRALPHRTKSKPPDTASHPRLPLSPTRAAPAANHAPPRPPTGILPPPAAPAPARWKASRIPASRP